MSHGICCIKTCDSPHFKGGWCREHWEHWEIHGIPELRLRRQRNRRVRPPSDLFWAKVNKDGPVPDYRPDLGPCWIWTGYIAPQTGYGNFGSSDGPGKLSHRWSYERYVEAVPPRYQVDHLCRIRHCVRPDHLEAVTQQENIRRQFEAAGITHCPKGHEYDEENTYYFRGARQCRACGYMHNAAKYAARKWEQLNPDRACVVCGASLPFIRRTDAKYCSMPCRRAAGYATQKAKRHAASAARKAAKAAGAVGDMAA